MSLRLSSVLAGVFVFAALAPGARAQVEPRSSSGNEEGNPAPVVPPESAPAEADAAEAAPVSATVPSLAKVMELARSKAPIVNVARASVAVSKTALVGARLGPLANPYVEILGDRGTQNATRDVTLQGTIVVPVEISGQREKREAEAQALVDWQGAELTSTRAVAVADAVRAYGQLVVADARIRALSELSEVARAEAAYYEARVGAGDATLLDAKLAELEAAKHVVALAEGRADRTRALAAVSLSTGSTYTDPPAGGPAPPAPRAAPVVKDAKELPAVKASAAQATFHAREKDRAAIEAHTPLNLLLTVGRGDLGELRVGGGIAWSLPVLRTNQGEQARAEASRSKAIVEREEKRRAAEIAAAGLTRERGEVRQAIDAVVKIGEPAAQAALDAALAMQQAGKGDLLRVLTARRDLALLQARRLELLQREWNLVSDLVALTGELP